MTGDLWRVRLTAIVAAGGFLATAFGIRVLTAGNDVLNSSGALAQHSGTALYAATIYAGVLLVLPAARATTVAALAIGFCWVVELSQLTGVPAELSEHNLLARLVLGVQFDVVDLAWYAIGVLPLAVIHRILARTGRPPAPRPTRRWTSSGSTGPGDSRRDPAQ
ncbi:DUF2809 domain-containing protein [Actinoplanes sp. NPDC051346]|uniref:ribosomal maturation YjgA family protein n=1 Tax=Actinoplanes sp. NPDC051346 TaxID=3155048 RepID=UPI00341F184E